MEAEVRLGFMWGFAPPPINARRWSAWVSLAGKKQWLLPWPYRRADRGLKGALRRASAAAPSGRWLNASIRPVLIHGPRSLTCMRAGGWQTHEAQETKKEKNHLDAP